MQMIFRIFVMSLLFTGSLSLAATITGTVTNKTTGKPAAGDVVTLLNPMTGMSESARATTDGHGHYSLEKAGNGPALLKATHQGADYFIAAPEGNASGDITVYDVAAKVDGVGIDEDVIGLVESANGQLRVIERYAVHNASAPPRTEWSPRTFEIVLPEGVVVEGASAQRPGVGSLPTTIKLDPAGSKGRYSFNFPIQPDEGDKGTLFQIEYNLPYNGGKFTFHPQLTIAARTVWVMMPKSMNFAAGAGSNFQSSPQDPGFQTFVARDALPGKSLEFTVSGNGSMPRDDQSAQGAQSGPAQESGVAGNQPGGGLGPPVSGSNPISSKYTWWILGAIALLMVVAIAFLLRKPAAGAAMNAGTMQAIAAPAGNNAALLNALKEELFAVESEKIAGSLTAAEYAELKAALETVLKRALKKTSC
jgi:hypothetical protein